MLRLRLGHASRRRPDNGSFVVEGAVEAAQALFAPSREPLSFFFVASLREPI